MPKPDYYHELNSNAEVLKERVAALDQKVDEARGKFESVAELSKEIAVVKQQIAEQTKRVDEWDRRMWGMLSILVGALLSLAAGLIVTLARK